MKSITYLYTSLYDVYKQVAAGVGNIYIYYIGTIETDAKNTNHPRIPCRSYAYRGVDDVVRDIHVSL